MSRATPTRATAEPSGKTEAPETVTARQADAHFSGKRRTERFVTDLAAELRGGGAALTGRAVDLSEGGVRVRLVLEGLQDVKDSADAMGFLRVVERHFARGLEVGFPERDLRLRATVVRLVAPPKASGDLFIACRFATALTPEQLAGLLPAPPPPPAAPDAPLPFEARREGKLRLFVYDGTSEATSGPCVQMRVEGASPEAIDAVPDTTAPVTVREMLEKLGEGERPARLVHGKSAVWKGRLRLLAASAVKGTPPTVRVRFTLLEPIGDAIATVMRARD